MLQKSLQTILKIAGNKLNPLQGNITRLYTPLSYKFSGQQPPKGFEKFKRKSTSTNTPPANQNTTSQPQQQKPKQEEKPVAKEEKTETAKNETNQENKNQEKVDETQENQDQNATKEQNKTDQTDASKNQQKFTFTYQAKLFGNNDEKPKGENENKDKDNQTDGQINIDFNFNSEKNKQYLLYFGLGAAFMVWQFADLTKESDYIDYTNFIKNYLETDRVKRIDIVRMNEGNFFKTFANVLTHSGETKKIVLGNVDHFLENLEQIQIERGKNAHSMIPVIFQYKEDPGKTLQRVLNFVYIGATIVIMYSLFKSVRGTMGSLGGGKGGDVFNMGKSNVKVFGVDSQVKTQFKDVAGLDEAKNEISEFVDFLKKPQKYLDLGAKIPRGALLAGPPGTGQTLLAKACAGQAGVAFFFISGSDFVEMFVGVGASRVRDLFKQAKAKSPSIIFIDEIDAVGRKRENRVGGNDERDNTLNQLLVEMDGFGTDSNVIVLAATNRKELLDPALTRPGRFDRTIDITLPDIEGRKQILLVHLAPLKLDKSRSIDDYARRLSTLTPGFSGAELANLCNEAALLAARKNRLEILPQDFEMASERVIAGLEKKKTVSEEERKVVAVHESGHALASWFLEGGNPLLKLTIIPRSKGSLGFAQYLPNESSLETREELVDRLCCILGGRCAEEVYFGRVTTGAYDDLKKAYQLCHAMITQYGMSENLGYIGYAENEYSKTYSDQTNKLIDDEIQKLIDKATIQTKALLTEQKDLLEKLSSNLMEQETLDLKKIVDVLGERPFKPKSNYKAYLEQNKDEKWTSAATEAPAKPAEAPSTTATINPTSDANNTTDK